ncbi:MAG TPA: multicopper oxidase family protein [Rhizomicrobium sp.]
MRGPSTIRPYLLGLAVAVMALAVPLAAHAADPAPVNPCTVPVDYNIYGMKPFQNPPEVVSQDGVLTTTLDIHYSDPATTKVGECGLTLRTYGGSLIGPTLKVKPGDVMKITVKNNLPTPKGKDGKDEPCENNDGTMSEMAMEGAPAIYNVTNLHTHGLHVSPGNNPNGTHQDNIFVTICPGTTAQYEIHVPSDHPAGTFWYHAHIHGSTAIQVSSSMEGAIIIEGGLDNVPQIKAAKDQIFVLQQISYDEHGMLEDEDDMYDYWERTGSRTMVNGQLVPVVTMRPGEVQRWRMIHAGVDESLYMKSNAGPLYEIATDGNALGRIDAWRTPIELEPGYRSDVLFKAPLKTGRYYLLSGKIPAAKKLLFLALPGALKSNVPDAEAKYVVAVDVQGTPNNMPLPTEAELRPLAPYKPITRNELTGTPQKVTFALEPAICDSAGLCRPCKPKGDNDPDCTDKYMVDWHVYPYGSTRTLKLNTASQWTLTVSKTSQGQAHPFHVHVNPFEMVRQGPNGIDEVVWKDTLMVREGAPLKYRIVKSRYEDYPGAFVLHCHILPHEDQGMMQKVEIVP